MATKLDTPVDQEQITHQAIMQVRFIIPHKLTPAEDDIVIDKDNVRVGYWVHTLGADNEETNVLHEAEAWNSLPTVFKDELKAVYDRLVADAKGKGYIGAGTDEDITAP